MGAATAVRHGATPFFLLHPHVLQPAIVGGLVFCERNREKWKGPALQTRTHTRSDKRLKKTHSAVVTTAHSLGLLLVSHTCSWLFLAICIYTAPAPDDNDDDDDAHANHAAH